MDFISKKYQIDTDENRSYLKEMTQDLVDFGRQFPARDGSACYLTEKGEPWIEKNRETFETSRMAHVYSIASLLGYEGCAELAEKAVKGLSGEQADFENGGWFTGVKSDGTPMDGKLCYTHAFSILAGSSALVAGIPGAKELLERALTEYDKYFWSEEEGLSCDTWNTEFTVKDPYRGLNANMHTVEAFLSAADALNDPVYRKRAGRIIDHVLGWAENNNWRIPEHYTEDWKPDLECNKERPDDPFKPYGATPGHGLEWARLITQYAMSSFAMDLGEHPTPEQIGSLDDAAPYLEGAKNLYHRAVADAWFADGEPGIVYTTDWEGRPVCRDRMHWVLAEAINTASVLYRITGEEGFADDYAAFMQYLDEKVQDHVNGSWFHQMNEKNEVIGTVWPGKPDLYHAFQATLIPYGDVRYSLVNEAKMKH